MDLIEDFVKEQMESARSIKISEIGLGEFSVICKKAGEHSMFIGLFADVALWHAHVPVA